jgi:hypothetical protein
MSHIAASGTIRPTTTAIRMDPSTTTKGIET